MLTRSTIKSMHVGGEATVVVTSGCSKLSPPWCWELHNILKPILTQLLMNQPFTYWYSIRVYSGPQMVVFWVCVCCQRGGGLTFPVQIFRDQRSNVNVTHGRLWGETTGAGLVQDRTESGNVQFYIKRTDKLPQRVNARTTRVYILH